uniref:Uncharacterized protein n=1 Tax=Glossina pallidipes TaxID=7398 RepID=A0A1B0A3Q9_GLOPL
MLSTERIVARWDAERSIEKQQTIKQTRALDFGNDMLFEDLDDVAFDVESANNEKMINFHELLLTADDDFDDEKNNVNNSDKLRQCPHNYKNSFCLMSRNFKCFARDFSSPQWDEILGSIFPCSGATCEACVRLPLLWCRA